jgi:hypothetical protein
LEYNNKTIIHMYISIMLKTIDQITGHKITLEGVDDLLNSLNAAKTNP